ncbi:MAG: hypothetical protein EOO73_19450 [Myxococcales bacterium]|nr:MAG: hypothetical protein EOO73_19450 [Myxococcales bacterium]
MWSRPPGAGADLEISNSGWRQEWAASLPAAAAALIAPLHCEESWETWIDEPGEGEDLAINCLSYDVAFAFCAAQGGRVAHGSGVGALGNVGVRCADGP